MIIDYGIDGQKADINTLKMNNFNSNEIRDFRKSYSRDSGLEKISDHDYVFDFVGFLVNDNDDVFTVFPKNFQVENVEFDSSLLFKIIAKHRQRKPDLYMGENYDDILKTNYPFAAFFGVYDFFSKYGLFLKDHVFIRPNVGGKVNWKETIRLSGKYIINNEFAFFPLYYEKKYYFSTFLTECMTFAIDYTIEKFNFLIDLEGTGRDSSDFNYLLEKEIVLDKLSALRQNTFQDYLIELIDHLINFFSEIHQGGPYYFKHYSFSSVWENMVMYYLEENFKEVKNDELVFDKNISRHLKFTKPTFRPNLANSIHFFSPDHYHGTSNIQLIFDAKYYTNIQGMDYKQIAYTLFLNEYRENIYQKQKFSETYSALIVPSEENSSRIHFEMDPTFSISNQNIKVIEQYLDIREVMISYI